jgi:hypothetical protein
MPIETGCMQGESRLRPVYFTDRHHFALRENLQRLADPQENL